jgi:hypothetical protein
MTGTERFRPRHALGVLLEHRTIASVNVVCKNVSLPKRPSERPPLRRADGWAEGQREPNEPISAAVGSA